MDDIQVAKKSADAMWANDDAAKALGIRIDVSRPGHAEATFEVRPDMVNGHHVCHGGFLFALADTAFAFACNTYNRVTFASGATIDFLRPAKLGDTIVASASEVHRGGRIGVYDVVCRNQHGEPIATFRGRSFATREPLFE
ncbi:MAG: hydroxyphenylacetyl-CoA thioesterase PaaI [Woeseiaceae bacterium]|nr:hydroxyphenylacetyl-CoA thioesterase PaaI [Woeseiaceae bacterium]